MDIWEERQVSVSTSLDVMFELDVEVLVITTGHREFVIDQALQKLLKI